MNYWAQEIFLYGNIINIFEEKYYELNKKNSCESKKLMEINLCDSLYEAITIMQQQQ